MLLLSTNQKTGTGLSLALYSQYGQRSNQISAHPRQIWYLEKVWRSQESCFRKTHKMNPANRNKENDS